MDNSLVSYLLHAFWFVVVKLSSRHLLPFLQGAIRCNETCHCHSSIAARAIPCRGVTSEGTPYASEEALERGAVGLARTIWQCFCNSYTVRVGSLLSHAGVAVPVPLLTPVTAVLWLGVCTGAAGCMMLPFFFFLSINFISFAL